MYDHQVAYHRSSQNSRHLLDILRISHKLSSSYQPQIDEQSEHTNQTPQQYLYCFINYQQDDCVDFLHMVEFAYNNSIHTGYTPFFANVGYHPCWMMLEHKKLSNNLVVEDRLTQLKEVHSKISGHLLQAQITYNKVVVQHHLDSSRGEPAF